MIVTFGCILDPEGNRRKVSWVTFWILGVALPFLSVWALWRLFTTEVAWGVAPLALGMYAFTMLGVTMGYHRFYTHKGYEVAPWLQRVLLIAGAMSMENDVRNWAGDHLRHHAYADIIGKDPHSPYEYAGKRLATIRGLIWSQFGWLVFEHRVPGSNKQLKLFKDDAAAERRIDWQVKWFPAFVLVSVFIGLPFYPWLGLNGVLIAGPLRIIAMLTATGFVNSLAHVWGTRARDSNGNEYGADGGRNLRWFAWVAAGELNHGDHHAHPHCPRHGRRAKLDATALERGEKPDKRVYPDPTWWAIQFFSWRGAIYNVRDVPDVFYFKPAELVPRPGSSSPPNRARAKV